jgi:hypothetical protein
MVTPGCLRLIPGMIGPNLETVIRDAVTGAGCVALVRALGFTAPLRRLELRDPSRTVRRLRMTRRTTLTAFVVELTGALQPGDVRAAARALRELDGARHHLLVVLSADGDSVALACDAPGSGLRAIVLQPSALRASDLDVLKELQPRTDEGDSAAAIRMMRALDRSRVTDRFFRDVVGVRDGIARWWSGIPQRAQADREALALLLLSRLVFLYFLQRRGLLVGDLDYMPRLLRDWLHGGSPSRATTFYRARLRALFFGVLNRRPERRTARARALGTLPYLNGGLFEVHRLEQAHPALDLPDDAVCFAFSGLLEKYRFATPAAEGAASGVADAGGVDPEMLGRIFEGLMPGERRERTGTFYTPADTVDRVVTDTLLHHLACRTGCDASQLRELLHGGATAVLAAGALHDEARRRLRTALSRLRVIDPACGSGAFLLGALSQLTLLRQATDRDDDVPDTAHVKREIVAHSLHGVDLLEDAALICSLRLWLSLVPDCDDVRLVPPLPNLDRRIRQGDALVDPLDIGALLAGRPLDTTAPPQLRALTRRLAPLSTQYLAAGPEAKPALRAQLERLESAVAGAWLNALSARLDYEVRELEARAADCDLFGEPAAHTRVARLRLGSLEQRRAELASFEGDVGGTRLRPFFSFRVHFAEAAEGFDVVLSNPPWVRAHRWPPATRRLLRERYRVCSAAGWPAAARASGTPAGAGAQVDLSLLFLERSIGLLAPGGTLGMLLPAKLFRSLYAGGARELLLQETLIVTVDDHSLDHRMIFDADAFTSVLIANRRFPDDAPRDPVRVTLRRRSQEPLHFCVAPEDLPLVAGDARAPWLLVPPGCRRALRTMQQNGTPVGESLVIRRGVMTGANDVMVVRDVEPKLGDMARIRTDGFHRAVTAQGRRAYSAWVEASTLRPALRGADISAWCARPARHVLWTPANDDAANTAPLRLGRYLRRHRHRLRQQDSTIGALHRLSPHTLGAKVVWSDLAADLRAAAVPSLMRGVAGTMQPVIPLNSVYFIATSSTGDSLLLAAYLNSLPVRVFARAIAERAKDAHFRFFAWTIGVIPLPRDWRSNDQARELLSISAAAHRDGALPVRRRTRLDALVTSAYGIDAAGTDSLAAFDRWLTDAPAQEQAV